MEHYWEHDPTWPGVEEDAAAVTRNAIGNTIRRGLDVNVINKTEFVLES